MTTTLPDLAPCRDATPTRPRASRAPSARCSSPASP